jgi:multisubunit Na+/H+ antiporter MnhE subunit
VFTQSLTEISTRNIKIIMFQGSKERPVRRADNLTPSVSQLSRQCGIFNISQPYRPPRPVTGIPLLFYFYFTSQEAQYISVLQPGTLTTRPQRQPTSFYITYIHSVRTSEETQYISVLKPGTLTTRPQRRSTFFYITYINSVRTSEETQYISVLKPGTLTTRPQRQPTSFYITYINSVRTSEETQYISVLKSGTLTTRPQRRSYFQ